MFANTNLLIRRSSMRLELEQIGFDYLKFESVRLAPGESSSGATDINELGIVALGGVFRLQSDRTGWDRIGGRANVFGGLPWAAYLPPDTQFTVTAATDCDLAFCYCKAEEE